MEYVFWALPIALSLFLWFFARERASVGLFLTLAFIAIPGGAFIAAQVPLTYREYFAFLLLASQFLSIFGLSRLSFFRRRGYALVPATLVVQALTFVIGINIWLQLGYPI